MLLNVNNNNKKKTIIPITVQTRNFSNIESDLKSRYKIYTTYSVVYFPDNNLYKTLRKVYSFYPVV